MKLTKILLLAIVILLACNIGVSQTHWDSLTTTVSPNERSMIFINSTTGFITHFNGTEIYKTTNGGYNWTSLNMANTPTTFFQNVNGDLYVGTTQPDIAYKSTNNGMSWSSIYTNASLNTTKNIYIQNSNIYLVGEVSGHGIVQKSTNSGTDWTAFTPMPNTSPFKKAEQINSIVYGLTTHEVFDITNSSQYSSYPNNLNDMTHKGSELWIVGDSGKVYYTPGATLSGNLKQIKFYNDSGFVCGTSGKFWKYNVTMNPTWREIDSGLLNHNIVSFAFAGSDIICITDNGIVYKLTNGTLTSIQHNYHSIPTDYALSNYPNPFNPVTTIKYSIPLATHIKLIVVDIQGREVEVLEDNKNQNAGNFQTKWEPKNQASGVYFINLYVNDLLIQSNKMLFIK